jgi:hypothetical protein
MWRRAVSGDPWELAQVAIVALATIAFASVASVLVWGWVTGSVVAASSSAACLGTFALARRRRSAYVRAQSRDGMRSLEAMLAVAATVEDEHAPDMDRGEG